jgi:hypothetical protein
VADRAILFSAPMVRAILAGTKTQTRRLVRHVPLGRAEWCPKVSTTGLAWVAYSELTGAAHEWGPHPAYAAPGDRLWVRETWAVSRVFDRTRPSEIPTNTRDIPVWWAADGIAEESWMNRGRWRPSIHMPRWASRLTLEVTSVRVERLQDISEEDAVAEGAATPRAVKSMRLMHGGSAEHADARVWFKHLWDEINGTRAPWASNPWVWVVGFRVAAKGGE